MIDPNHIAAVIVQDMRDRTPLPHTEPLFGGLDLGEPVEWGDDTRVSAALVAALWIEGDDDDRAMIDGALSKLRERQYRDQNSNQ